VRQGRRFLKPLAYEAGWSVGFASALLLDAGDVPVPLHVAAPSGTGQRREPGGDGPSAPGPKAWVWRPGEALVMPPLPRLAIRDLGLTAG
jgi:hypothetical protein